ncbi:T9SS type A sorting domain-containing protein [Flavobacterium sp.]|uniref:T9SS type A sorting domain-containing protein n=1 Tax=Flavobacterium sp. TaxID=239 RepID=UPI0035287D76
MIKPVWKAKRLPNMVGEYVHYMIRFENTGTYPAENIVVKDMIDTTKFDIATLVPISGSHEFYTRINGNKVEFIFENINLPFNDANNDGYVVFKIKTLPSLVIGDTFSNQANIYFDYNFPITTNNFTTTVQQPLSIQDFAFDKEFTIYPNPVKNELHISNKNKMEIQSLEIYNVLGQLVMAITHPNEAIEVSQLKTGNYFVKVTTEKGSSTTKFIKD